MWIGHCQFGGRCRCWAERVKIYSGRRRRLNRRDRHRQRQVALPTLVGCCADLGGRRQCGWACRPYLGADIGGREHWRRPYYIIDRRLKIDPIALLRQRLKPNIFERDIVEPRQHFTVFILGRDRNDFSVEGAHFACHFPVSRLDLRHAPLRLDPIVERDHSQPERRRLLENYFRAIRSMIVVDEHRQSMRRTVFLHIDRRRPNVERSLLQQSIVKMPVDLRIHIVDIGLELEKFLRLAPVGGAVINPQDVGNFEIVSAGAVADLLDGKIIGQIARVLGKRRNDRGARRSGELFFDGRAISREADEKFGGGGRGDGHQTVGALYGAGADVDFRDKDAIDVEIIDADSGADDVNDAVDGADLMKMNFVGGAIMNFTFGDGELLENEQGQFFDLEIESGAFDDRSDISHRPMMMMMFVIMIVVMVVMMIVEMVVMMIVEIDVEMDGGDTVLGNVIDDDVIMIVERKFFEFGDEVGDGDAELEAGAEEHIAADAGEAVKINRIQVNHSNRK